jgi:phosphate uptake regulator
MQRKVVKHGPSTLTISLPFKWCKENLINEGDLLNIKENDDSIIIQLDKTTSTKKIKLDLSGFDKLSERIISAYYKEGYDEFDITFETANELKSILNVINKTFIGLEIIEQSHNHIKIKTLAKIDASEFKNIFRKIFYQLLNIIDESYDAIDTKNKNKTQSLIMLDNNINRFTDYCKRLISRNLVPLKNNGLYHYIIVEQLETIGDQYKDINKHVLKNDLIFSNELKQTFNDVNKFFRQFNDLYYNFELEKMKVFWKKRNELISNLNEHQKNLNKNEMKINYYLTNIVNLLFDMYDLIIIVKS